MPVITGIDWIAIYIETFETPPRSMPICPVYGIGLLVVATGAKGHELIKRREWLAAAGNGLYMVNRACWCDLASQCACMA